MTLFISPTDTCESVSSEFLSQERQDDGKTSCLPYCILTPKRIYLSPGDWCFPHASLIDFQYTLEYNSEGILWILGCFVYFVTVTACSWCCQCFQEAIHGELILHSWNTFLTSTELDRIPKNMQYLDNVKASDKCIKDCRINNWQNVLFILLTANITRIGLTNSLGIPHFDITNQPLMNVWVILMLLRNDRLFQDWHQEIIQEKWPKCP